jgi:hypothetical protein
VLEVSVVREKEDRIFAVVYTLGVWREWGYDFVDEDGDGRPEIQLGQRMLNGDVIPRVSFKWDAKKKSYAGPKGGPGDHFRVIDPTDVWKELRRLKDEKTVFPPEEDFDVFEEAPAKSVAGKDPYAYRTLKGMADEQLLAFMGRTVKADVRGRDAETVEPTGFWTLNPKAAALELVETNRTAKHRLRVQLAIDDQDGAADAVPGDRVRGRYDVDPHRGARGDQRDSRSRSARIRRRSAWRLMNHSASRCR